MSKTHDTPLQCSVDGEQLVVRIGIGTLAWAAKKRNGGPVPNRVKVVDRSQFASDVADSLMHDDEVGNTMLCDLLDKAMEDAMNKGSTGLTWK